MNEKVEKLWNELTDIHLQIKEHPFRQIFAQDKYSVARYEKHCQSYLDLIYKSTDKLCDLAYHTTEFEYLKKDLWWIHNFRGGLWNISQMAKDDYRHYTVEHRHDQDKTNFASVADGMLWLEKYVMYLHRFLETKQLNGIVHVDYECQALPHNGWYYYHLTEYKKDENGKWQLVSPIKYVDKEYSIKLKAHLEKIKDTGE